MKRLFNFLPVLFLVAVFFTSCLPEEEVFDENLLIGKWRSGTEYYRYDAGGNGKTWDTSDDVTEEDPGGDFTWTLVKSELTHIHIIEMGGSVPKVYTVTELTATTLKYEDDFDSYTYTKVVQ